MFSHHGSLTVEFGTGEPFGNILQDGNDIDEKRTRNQELASSADSFFYNLNIGVVIGLNVDTVGHRQCRRTNKTNPKKGKGCLPVSRNIVKGDVRPDMLQEITWFLQKLTEEAPDVYYFARLTDTTIGRIEVFCEHPATCPPDIPIGKYSEGKSPARSTIMFELYCLPAMI